MCREYLTPPSPSSPLPTCLPLTLGSPRGPKYHLLAHAVLSLAEVQDGFRTHDLAIACNGERSAVRAPRAGLGLGAWGWAGGAGV